MEQKENEYRRVFPFINCRKNILRRTVDWEEMFGGNSAGWNVEGSS